MAQVKWSIDPSHSEINFRVKHLMITNVNGKFKNFEGSIYTTDEDFSTAEVDLAIDTSSIDTGNEQRDQHLKGADFFDVENFKEINVQLNTIEAVDQDGSYNLYCDITIRDVKHQVKLQAEFGGIAKDPWGNVKAGITVNGKLNRKDFGLIWNQTLETGGVLVSEDVAITASLQLAKQA